MGSNSRHDSWGRTRLGCRADRTVLLFGISANSRGTRCAAPDDHIGRSVMRGMSIKAKIGWAVALFVAFLLFMAITAAQPSWGAEQQAKHGGRVHYYTIIFACTENRLNCVRLPTDEFSTYDLCDARIQEIKENQDLYGVPWHPLVMGKCVSWSPPFGNPSRKG